jgi:hypothetical protein
MKKAIHISFYLSFFFTMLQAQYAPAAGVEGSMAVHKDSSIIAAWATECNVERGFIKISDTTLTYNGSNRASQGSPSDVTGVADGGVVSLGDSGIAVISFKRPVKNGPGPDFAIFENGFQAQEPPQHYFLELAFVEVSSDGDHYVRFPAVSESPAAPQLRNFGQLDPTHIHNLAGKYVANYGTPFNLDDVKDNAQIDVSKITHIKILDVIGSVKQSYASYDSKGNIINDPWPTPFATGGFDLDAVAAIHLQEELSTGLNALHNNSVEIYPNPVKKGQRMHLNLVSMATKNVVIRLIDITGHVIFQDEIQDAENITSTLQIPANVKPGWYAIHITTPDNTMIKKIVIRE